MDVLVVDDNPKVRTGLAKVLERGGLLVRTAENGLAAFVELQKRTYKVVVCDIQMPFMDGLELYEELKRLDPDAARRVVFVSAWLGEPQIREFIENTGCRHLEKPFEISDFVRTVREVAAAA